MHKFIHTYVQVHTYITTYIQMYTYIHTDNISNNSIRRLASGPYPALCWWPGTERKTSEEETAGAKNWWGTFYKLLSLVHSWRIKFYRSCDIFQQIRTIRESVRLCSHKEIKVNEERSNCSERWYKLELVINWTINDSWFMDKCERLLIMALAEEILSE